MGAPVDYGLSLKDAIARQADVYDVVISQWGTGLVAIPPDFDGNESYPDPTEPPITDSIAGVAIGPLSDVDRCWLTHNASKLLPALAATVGPAIRQLNVGAPLLFTQPAKILPAPTDPLLYTAPDAMREGALRFFPTNGGFGLSTKPTIIPETYVKVDGTVANFRGPTPIFGNLKFLSPTLHLQLLLKPGILPPMKRGPATWAPAIGETTTAAGGGAETTIILVPMFGRKNVSVQVYATPAGGVGPAQATVRVAGVRILSAGNTTQEFTMGQKTSGLFGSTGHMFDFSFCNPQIDYIILYISNVLGGGAATSAVATRYVITGED